jgi:type III restriction enzyme
VKFDTDELVKKAINSLDTNLHVSQIVYKIEQGEMNDIKSRKLCSMEKHLKRIHPIQIKSMLQ